MTFLSLVYVLLCWSMLEFLLNSKNSSRHFTCIFISVQITSIQYHYFVIYLVLLSFSSVGLFFLLPFSTESSLSPNYHSPYPSVEKPCCNRKFKVTEFSKNFEKKLILINAMPFVAHVSHYLSLSLYSVWCFIMKIIYILEYSFYN